MSKDLQETAAAVQARAAELLEGSGVEQHEMRSKYIKQCLDNNERGDGCMFASLHSRHYLYNVTPRDGEWYAWNGRVWEVDETRRAHAAVEDCAMKYEDQQKILEGEIHEQGINKKSPDGWKIAVKEKYKSRAERLRSANGVSKVLHWAPIVQPEMACRESDFDKQPWLLPVANGVIDLRTGALTQGRPEDRLTRALDIEYDPHADYAPWVEFVQQVTGDSEKDNDSDLMTKFLQRTFGYAITGHSFEQFIWVFLGPGRNGKGTMFEMIADILGPYYHPISRAMLIEQRNEQSPSAASEHKYSLLGKRIIVGDETNKGQRIDGSAIKSLTGEDRITCRPLFKSEITFTPSHTLFLHTNHLPVGLTRDFALIQRLLLIEFPYMYVDDPEAEAKKTPIRSHLFRKKDKSLKDRLRACRQGILRWIVEGCLAWQEHGLQPPESVLANVTQLARDEDYVGQFLDDCLEYLPDQDDLRIPCSRMYEAFKWWWAQNMDDRDKRCPPMKSITGQLRERGHLVDKVGGKYWLFRHKIAYAIEDDVNEFIEKRGGKS